MIPFMQPSNENRLTRETTGERYCSIQCMAKRAKLVCPATKVAPTPKTSKKTYPHIVEMIVPVGGFGRKLADMYEWHRR
jgi:hypothetical protein